LYNLVNLSFTNMRISAVTELTRFTKIEHLYLYDNQITSLQGIESMKNLKSLYLQNNEISDIGLISELKNLEVIYVTKNKIKSLKNFLPSKLTHLKKFYVQPNELLPDKELIQFQNKHGIICRQG